MLIKRIGSNVVISKPGRVTFRAKSHGDENRGNFHETSEVASNEGCEMVSMRFSGLDARASLKSHVIITRYLAFPGTGHFLHIRMVYFYRNPHFSR